LAPWGRDIGRFLGDDSNGINFVNLTNDDPQNLEYKTVNLASGTHSFYWAILFTVLGTLLLDFNADNCQAPSRAYLLDMCVPEEQAHALSTFTLMSGIGGCFGYALGAINWDNTIFANFIGDNIKTVFTLVTIIFIVAMLCTITSFREIPLKLLESDEMLRPVTHVAVKKEKDRLKAIENDAKNPTASVSYEKEKSPQSIDEVAEKSYSATEKREASSVSLSRSSDDEEDDQEESISFFQYLKSILFMPKSLRILCITNLLSWMGHILYCLYFTDFVGESVFHGDPAAPIDSPEYAVSI
jgi:solute carrier family 45 protein 1/2/4